ncbi:PP_RS20740 family protein [Marinobacter oulmenensis]
MMDEFADSEAFGGDVDADKIEEVVKSTTFEAWHRPRKHWIRSKQWWAAIDSLRKDPAHEQSSYFNVLTLPGGELLDVRYFHSKLKLDDEKTNVKKLRLVGFINNTKDYEEAQRNLPLLGISQPESKDALIQNDTIDNLSENGVVNRAFRNRGPFEVVNLDYCNSVAPPGVKSRVASIFQILRYQFSYQAKPWVFMFTTRTTRGAVSEDFFGEVFDIIKDNVEKSDDFLNQFFDHYMDSLDGLDDGNTLELKSINECEHHYSEFFILGFLKWIASSAIDSSVKVKLTSVVRYDVEGDQADSDMFSLVLRFEKVGLRGEDPRNLVRIPDDEGGIEPEGLVASRFVRKVKESKKVENMLFGEQESYRSISKDLAAFLDQCGKCIDTFWEDVCRPEVESKGWDLEQIKA